MAGDPEASDSGNGVHACGVGHLAGKDPPRCLPCPLLLSPDLRIISSSWFRMEQWISQCNSSRNRVPMQLCWFIERCSACGLLSLRLQAQVLRCLILGFETKTCSK
jgi:hypothetical protein